MTTYQHTATFNGQTLTRDSKTRAYTHVVVAVNADHACAVIGWSSSFQLAQKVASTARGDRRWSDADHKLAARRPYQRIRPTGDLRWTSVHVLEATCVEHTSKKRELTPEQVERVRLGRLAARVAGYALSQIAYASRPGASQQVEDAAVSDARTAWRAAVARLDFDAPAAVAPVVEPVAAPVAEPKTTTVAAAAKAPKSARKTKAAPAKAQHGGAREGAGRKKAPAGTTKAASVTVRLTADQRAQLDAYASSRGLSTSAAIVALIAATAPQVDPLAGPDKTPASFVDTPATVAAKAKAAKAVGAAFAERVATHPTVSGLATGRPAPSALRKLARTMDRVGAKKR